MNNKLIIDLSVFITDSSFLYAMFYSIYEKAVHKHYKLLNEYINYDPISKLLDDILISLEFIYNNENYKDLCTKRNAIYTSLNFEITLKKFFESIKPEKGILEITILFSSNQDLNEHFIELLRDFPFNFDKFLEIHVEEKELIPNNIYIC